MRSLRPVVAIAVAAALLAATGALAAQYPAWGDTGWVYASKRDCCDGALQIAQEYSAQACYGAGGVPRPTTGTRRGVCQWDRQQDPWGRTLFRCQAEAALWRRLLQQQLRRGHALHRGARAVVEAHRLGRTGPGAPRANHVV